MKGTFTFLGTGASMGIPVIGCTCPVCLSPSPYNKRLRSSGFVYYGGKRFIIDAGPDFRQQCLIHQITCIDGVLFTHAHYDHVSGIDDLRPLYYNRESPLPLLMSAETSEEVIMRCHYLLSSSPHKPLDPKLHLEIFDQNHGEIYLERVSIQYVTYEQGGMKVNGFRIGDLAYLSDIRHFSPSIFEQLKGVRTLIISALRFTPSPLHLSVDEAIDFSKKLDAEKVWLTHISHELEHIHTNAYLPTNVRVAYDGLTIEF